MASSYQTWQVRGFTRDEIDYSDNGDRFKTGATERVTVVFDPRGWIWEVTTEPDEQGREQVTSLTIHGRIDQAALRSVPLRDLAYAATGYWASKDAHRSEGFDTTTAHIESALEPGDLRRTSDPPDLATFARAWNEIDTRQIVNNKKVSRRDVLRKRFNVSVHTIDKWTRAARDAGLIESATVGRKRDTKTPDDKKSPRTSKKKEQQK